jgi:hypothetical protein
VAMGRPLRVVSLLLLWLGACAPEGPSAFVTFNLKPDANCVYTSGSSNVFFPIGRYDIAKNAPHNDAGGDACAHPYVVHLLVNSYLRSNSDQMLGRAEPNILQLHSAEVRLMSIDKKTLEFGDPDDPKRLPNPFLVITNNSLFPAQGSTPSTGIAGLEAIPVAYAPYLTKFRGRQILADIQIFGTTTGDVDVDFKPFVYPIEICDGCNSLCLKKDITNNKMSPEDITGDHCADNSGNDDRVCIDTNC